MCKRLTPNPNFGFIRMLYRAAAHEWRIRALTLQANCEGYGWA